MMDPKQKEELKTIIEKEIVKTEKKIIGYKEMSEPIGPENAIGRVSRMDAINNKSVVEAALRKAEQKLDGLKNARHRLNDEGFGICSRCKEPIPIKRIVLMPQSRYCVRCAR